MATVYTKTSVFRQWLKGLQRFCCGPVPLQPCCAQATYAPKWPHHRRPSHPAADACTLRMFVQRERVHGSTSPVPERTFAGPTNANSLPTWLAQHTGHSVTRYGLRQPIRPCRLPYFMGLATGSGRPSFQLTRSAMVSRVGSTFLNSPVADTRRQEGLNCIAAEVVVAVLEANSPTLGQRHVDAGADVPAVEPVSEQQTLVLGHRYRSSCGRSALAYPPVR